MDLLVKKKKKNKCLGKPSPSTSVYTLGSIINLFDGSSIKRRMNNKKNNKQNKGTRN